MYAVITLGNQQFKVRQGDKFLSQKTGVEVGKEFEKQIQLLSNENKIHIGTPFLNGSKVTLRVLEDVKGTKIDGFKYKRRKNYRRHWGHRQQLQKLEVVNIVTA
ncbi:MAG: 50S ribosomal protein L21 [Leptospiraceae bacterium]|nr:50S ribosomal protein L21 [Leptospiraceae bacterium]